MTLPPQVQTLVDQIVQVMGLHGTRPSALEINMDGEGIVQDVKPKLIYRRGAEGKSPAHAKARIAVVLLTDGRYVNALTGHAVDKANLATCDVMNPGQPTTWIEHSRAIAGRTGLLRP